jgi:hypothetical protein
MSRLTIEELALKFEQQGTAYHSAAALLRAELAESSSARYGVFYLPTKTRSQDSRLSRVFSTRADAQIQLAQVGLELGQDLNKLYYVQAL